MSLTFGSVRGLGSLIFSGLGFPGPSGREQGAAAPGPSAPGVEATDQTGQVRGKAG